MSKELIDRLNNSHIYSRYIHTDDASTMREAAASIESLETVLADHKRLVRELDVLLNGEEGAAEQASLCDIVSQVRREGIRSGQAGAAPAQEPRYDEAEFQRMVERGTKVWAGEPNNWLEELRGNDVASAAPVVPEAEKDACPNCNGAGKVWR